MPQHFPTMAVVLALVLAAAIELAVFVMVPRCSAAATENPAIGTMALISGCRGAWR